MIKQNQNNIYPVIVVIITGIVMLAGFVYVTFTDDDYQKLPQSKPSISANEFMFNTIVLAYKNDIDNGMTYEQIKLRDKYFK